MRLKNLIWKSRKKTTSKRLALSMRAHRIPKIDESMIAPFPERAFN